MLEIPFAASRSASTIEPCSALSATPFEYGISIGSLPSSGRITKP
jgi:hypothetical protein